MEGPATTNPLLISSTPSTFFRMPSALRLSFSKVFWSLPNIFISMGLEVLIKSPNKSAIRCPKDTANEGWEASISFRN